jgi:hypothetical protein
VDEPGVVNVPLDDLAGALAVLDHLQHSPAGRLVEAREANDRRLAEHFTWERFGDQVEAGLRADLPPVGRAPLARRLRLAVVAATSPSGPFRGPGPRLVVRGVRDRLRN